MLKRIAGISIAVMILLSTFLSAAARPAYFQQVGNGTPASCTETALNEALASPGTVQFNCGPNPVTIPITWQMILDRKAEYTIDGGNTVTLDAGRRTRFFRVDQYSSLTLRNITLQNGFANPAVDAGLRDAAKYGQGGAVYVDTWADFNAQNVTFKNNEAPADSFKCVGGGALYLNGFGQATISDSKFIGNKALNGGAINNLTYDLFISNTLFEGNVANHNAKMAGIDLCGGGGALYIDGAGYWDGNAHTISIERSTFRANTTNAQGGAIVSLMYTNDQMRINNSTFENNRATYFNNSQHENYGNGGALAIGGEESNRPFYGVYLISNSVFNGNHADGKGGAIFPWNTPVDVQNSTITNNEANTPSASTYFKGIGGAVLFETPFAPNPNASLFANVTIANNHAGFSGGGISFWTGSSVHANLANSIIAYNTIGANNASQSCTAPLTDLGGNLQNDATAKCTPNIAVGDPKLQALADNGGPTKTLALASGSPAINRGVAARCQMTDQRGYIRSGACDSGAFEFNGVKINYNHHVQLPMVRSQ